ncbi:MAG TPA: phosphatidate cytidylyltransferase [Cyanobacteria bacterium UBA9971]|nr:phosphatidate cytidylyltransferase [Cyanobacteria bacterium UBA9971]
MEFFHVTQNVQFAIIGIFAVLSVFSGVVVLKNLVQKGKDFTNLNLRVKSFWSITALFTLAIMGNKLISFVFVGFISFLALKEFLSLIPTRRADRRVLFWAYLAIPIQLYFLYTGWLAMFYLFIPLYMFLMIPFRMVTIGETEGFLKSAGTIHWGIMATVYSIGYLAAFLVLPFANNPVAGGVGLFIYIVFLTVINDAAQFCFGKKFGKNKIIPKISPNKTREGFLGGIITTPMIAFLIAPYLTPLTHIEALIAGLFISISGFIGDVVMSAIKRDLGVKDSGTLIPGHGGILDRLDSLIYTAPLFFHYTVYLHYRGIL